MSLDELRRWVRKHPFRPFCVHVSDGSQYDVTHHDFILLGQRTVEIGIVNDPEGFPDKIVSCDPLHITRVEPLHNGRRRNSKR